MTLAWVTGAGGMLGSELVASLRARGWEVLATNHDVDICDRSALVSALRGRRPRCVFNAAAYTAVDLAESEPERAFATNAEGAGVVAELARELAADLVHVSTDYVFEGPFGVPLREDAPTAPRGVYARSKRLGEERVLATADDAHRVLVVRTSWTFGANPRSFVGRMLSLMATRETLDVVVDQHGRPTSVDDLADVLVELGVGGLSRLATGIYHFASPGVTTWHGFATAIHAAALRYGLPLATTTLRAVTSADFPRPAPRPSWSVLDCTTLEDALATIGKVPRPWQAVLDDLIAGLVQAASEAAPVAPPWLRR